nr:PREDICTED: ankyrin repeat domain-containing protein 6 isoform X1 [Bemisia tabaci]
MLEEDLRLAAGRGDIQLVTELLERGTKPTPGPTGVTPLQLAAAEGHEEILKLLIKHNCSVDSQDTEHGNTALHEASWKGYSRCVAILAKAKANLNLKNCGGFTALHLCCQNGHNQSCRELLLAGCDPDPQNNYGDTPLHTSARYGHAGVTRILISAQCRVSEQNKNGDTALHIAAAMGRSKLTRILLEAKSNTTIRNKQCETARDIAIRKDLDAIINILDKKQHNKAHSRSKKHSENVNKSSAKPHHSTKHKHKKKVPVENFKRDDNTKPWSPYGCHYYPDPKAFPRPNLDSLPPEPLQKGEQYYLDLAGNIRKGPIGVGYTCYCAPFFQQVEKQLNRSKAEMSECINRTRLSLTQRVADLERRTHGQISALRARTQWLSQSGRVPGSAIGGRKLGGRTRSLELVASEKSATKADNRRSLEVLEAEETCDDCVETGEMLSAVHDLSHDLDKLIASSQQLRISTCEPEETSVAAILSELSDVNERLKCTQPYCSNQTGKGYLMDKWDLDLLISKGTGFSKTNASSESSEHGAEQLDSGYSTKMCSNSQGPSPSLSGILECEHPRPLQIQAKCFAS